MNFGLASRYLLASEKHSYYDPGTGDGQYNFGPNIGYLKSNHVLLGMPWGFNYRASYFHAGRLQTVAGDVSTLAQPKLDFGNRSSLFAMGGPALSSEFNFFEPESLSAYAGAQRKRFLIGPGIEYGAGFRHSNYVILLTGQFANRNSYRLNLGFFL